MRPNLLITSAGRRVELLKSFQVESRRRGDRSSVYTCDLRPNLSSACVESGRSFAAPKLSSNDYVPWLMQTTKEQNVGLVVPTIDTELLLLANNQESFAREEMTLAVSSSELIQRCRDKRLTTELFVQLGIAVPRVLARDSLEFPCFVKPYDGSCSVGARKINTAAEVSEEMLQDDKLMFMEYIDPSFAEYTVDCYYDKNSKLRCLVPRERIEVRAGEVSKGITRKNWVYEYLWPRLQALPGARGCLTLQFFVKTSTKNVLGIEINPRFGGGFPLSYAAGANFPGWLMDEYLENEREIATFEDWEDNLLMLRYDAMVLVRG
jgi:carbamoyl-phosphate synthase large subunit